MMRICIFAFLLCSSWGVNAQVAQPVKQLLNKPAMKGATFSLIVKNVSTGELLYSHDIHREVTPASVLKTITTATALEIMGENYRFPTSLEYDGELKNGVLDGNLYILGSGDPTLGSAHFAPDKNAYTTNQNTFIPQWISALKEAGIQRINGSVIADESIFDTEGLSSKALYEDMGSYFAPGSYGLSVFDNQYRLYLQTGGVGSSPIITGSDPDVPSIYFHNYLTVAPVSTDSSFILGAPLAIERYLYGVVPANKARYVLKGDIPDPALFLAQYLTGVLNSEDIVVEGQPSCYRMEVENGTWRDYGKQNLITTYSPPLKDIVRVVNNASHNLFADALLKTIGLQYQPAKGEVISSYGRGIKMVRSYWKGKGLDISSLWMYDGCGLGATNKVSAAFMGDLLAYMATQSRVSKAFIHSLPQAGTEGTVRNFMKGSALQGKARLKSGGMSRVRCYAGYITKGDNQYAVAVFSNNYSCTMNTMTKDLERLLLSLF